MTDIEKRVRQAAEPFGKHDIHLHFDSSHGGWTVSIADNVEAVFAIGIGPTLDEAISAIRPTVPQPVRKRRRAAKDAVTPR
jgi:hypothetical protein